jgi:hypothetical protein
MVKAAKGEKIEDFITRFLANKEPRKPQPKPQRRMTVDYSESRERRP